METIQQQELETKWFVLRVLSGKERKIKEYLDVEVRRSGWASTISQILCPVEKVFKVVAGKKVMREKILYPGYILLEATTGLRTRYGVILVSPCHGFGWKWWFE